MNRIIRIISIFLFTIILLIFPFTAYAHQGRTDANGGHKDKNNVSGLGSYHYHHGYPPHLHPNGECPYNFDDKTDHHSSSGSSSSSYSTTTSSSKQKHETSILEIILLSLVALFFGWPLLVMIYGIFLGIYERFRKKPNSAIALSEPSQPILPEPRPIPESVKLLKSAYNTLSCPKCGSGMIMRKGRYGRFYGCTRYPNCRGTRKYTQI